MYRWCSKVQAQVNHYKSQESELLLILRQLLNHDLYSVLYELKQTPSMYSDKPSDDIKPKDTLDLSDSKYKIDSEYESLKSNNRDKRGLGRVVIQVILGLITLAVESISSYLNGTQQQKINTAV